MKEKLSAYEEKKRSVRFNRARREKKKFVVSSPGADADFTEKPGRHLPVYDVVQLGSKVVIGTGLGFLAGVATIAIVASAAEVVIAGVITKIAGVVGGTAAFSQGLRDWQTRNKKQIDQKGDKLDKLRA